jgi:thiol-disulfide isomerase/thioredoxin
MHLLLVLLATAFAVAPCCPPGSKCCPVPLFSPPLAPQTTKVVVKTADPAPIPADLLAAIAACEADKMAVAQAQAQTTAAQTALASVQTQIATAQTATVQAQAKLTQDAATLAAVLAKLYPIPTPVTPPTPPVNPPVPPVDPPKPTGTVVLMEVSRTTCGACNLMEPVLAKLKAAGYSITRVDCDVDATAQDKWKPTLLPTFIMLMDGKETNRITGMQSFDILKKWLDDTKQFKLEQGEAP